MSPDEVVRLKSILEERFHGAEAALKAALNEVDLAAAFPDFAEAVCAEVGGSRRRGRGCPGACKEAG